MSGIYVKVERPPEGSKLYLYDSGTETFEPYVQHEESWASYLGRRTADGVFLVLGYHLLKWCGIIVHVTVQS